LCCDPCFGLLLGSGVGGGRGSGRGRGRGGGRGREGDVGGGGRGVKVGYESNQIVPELGMRQKVGIEVQVHIPQLFYTAKERIRDSIDIGKISVRCLENECKYN
jgi:ribosomal protein L15